MAGEKNSDIRVSVPSDGSIAELLFPAGFDPACVSAELCCALLMQAGVVINERVTQRVAQILGEVTPGADQRVVVASQNKPIHGRDGWIEWLLPELADALSVGGGSGNGSDDGDLAASAGAEADADGVDGDEAENHYERSAFVMVEAGMPIARIHPPTMGDDGADVRGRILAAKQGKPAPLKHDASASLNSSGVLTAEVSGALVRSGCTVRITSMLDIAESVDFSTGNIEFEGSVRVRRSIKDLFEVRCRGTLEVGGLVEAATIECGGDLLARGGVAGRERGSLVCGANAHAKYFDATTIDVRGVLSFDRELINCETVVYAGIDAPRGSIIGGGLSVVGAVHVATIGSKGGTRTVLRLGSVPDLESALAQIERLSAELEKRSAQSAKELKKLSAPGRRLTPDEIERQTELMFIGESFRKHASRLVEARLRVEEKIREVSTVDVRIDKMLFHGVRFVFGGTECRITRDTKGPLRIVRGGDGMLHVQHGGGASRALTELGEITLVDRAAA
ncbi:MAG: DUF342 domain-containing protein [Phycisphaerales bacterium]